MTCVHLRELYSICQEHDLKITSADLVRIVCKQCGVVDTCPSLMVADSAAVLDADAAMDASESTVTPRKSESAASLKP